MHLFRPGSWSSPRDEVSAPMSCTGRSWKPARGGSVRSLYLMKGDRSSTVIFTFLFSIYTVRPPLSMRARNIRPSVLLSLCAPLFFLPSLMIFSHSIPLDVCQDKAEASKPSLGQNRSNHCATFKQRVLEI